MALLSFSVETKQIRQAQGSMDARLFVVEEGERCEPAYIFQKANVEARPRVTQYRDIQRRGPDHG